MKYAPKHKISLNIPYLVEEAVSKRWELDQLSTPYQVTSNNCANMVATALILCDYLYNVSFQGSIAIEVTGSTLRDPLLYDLTMQYLKLKACGWDEDLVEVTGAPHAKMVAPIWTPWDVEQLAFGLQRGVFS